jgi:uncharacterized repeat protein (TIGR03803 family)
MVGIRGIWNKVGVVGAVVLQLGCAHATTLKALYAFNGGSDGGSDGAYPQANLISDSSGNLWGTTFAGGKASGGTVFKIAPDGTETIIYSFCSQTNCLDGAEPVSGLIEDASGNLYGTTESGGKSEGIACNTDSCGVVFKLTPDGTETVLHAFTGGSDGDGSAASLIVDAQGNLYGTTEEGGSSGCGGGGCGTVFKVTPAGAETVLYVFCSQTDCTDGAQPFAGVISDSNGNLYGTTTGGGSGNHYCGGYYGCGTVYKLAPNGTEIVLYSFCSQTNCLDGAAPESNLIANKSGDLYGTTFNGGTSNAGTVFKVTPDGKETVLYSFTGGSDGSGPEAGVVSDQTGNLYGMTPLGGVNRCFRSNFGCGTVFEVGPDSTEKTLHVFVGRKGDYPHGALFRLGKVLYGTTSYGGGRCKLEGHARMGCGTVFALTY